MGTQRKTDLFRKLSTDLLFPFFWWTGWSANTITAWNFAVLGVGSLVCFALQKPFIGLFVAGVYAMVDYVDGAVARAGRGSAKGEYLDTSLDWVYLQLLLFTLALANHSLETGFLALVALNLSNWVEYNGQVKLRTVFPFGISHLIVAGILVGRIDLGITTIAIVQWVRLIIMYRRSLCKTT